MIVAAAVIMGVAFTGITGKGLFDASLVSSRHGTDAPVTPPSISYDEARDLFIQRRALFIDARHGYDYGAGHISGAVSIPLQEFDRNHPVLSGLSRDQLLVVYCDGEGCNSSVELAGLLQSSGFQHARVFFGGWTEWIAHRQPTEP